MNLPNLIRQIRIAKNLSYRDIERYASGEISGSYIHSIENGVISPDSVSVAKLKALAKGLQIDEKLIFDAARGYTPPPDEELADLMYEAFGGEKIDVEVLKKAVELIKLTRKGKS